MWYHVWYHMWYWFTHFLGHDVICEMRLNHVKSTHILYDIMTQEMGKSISHMTSWPISRDKAYDITYVWYTRLISRDKLLWHHICVISWLYLNCLWFHMWCDLIGGGQVLVAGATNRKYQVQVHPKARAALYHVCRPRRKLLSHVLARCSAASGRR